MKNAIKWNAVAAGMAAVFVFGTAQADTLSAERSSANTMNSMTDQGLKEIEARYQEGLVLERRGEFRAAVIAYREAGASGHGMAQRKLGDIYGTGKEGVDRDYETSLKWYVRTQAQGIEIPKPFVYNGYRSR